MVAIDCSHRLLKTEGTFVTVTWHKTRWSVIVKPSGELDCGFGRLQVVRNLPYPQVNSPALKIFSWSVVRTCLAWATSLWSVMHLYVKLKSLLPLCILFSWISIWRFFHSLLLHFITVLLQEFKVFKSKSYAIPGDNALLLHQSVCNTVWGEGKCMHNFHQCWMSALAISPSPSTPSPPKHGLYLGLFVRGPYLSSLLFSSINAWSFNEHRQTRVLSNNTDRTTNTG